MYLSCKSIIKKILTAGIFSILCNTSFGLENLFYILRNTSTEPYFKINRALLDINNHHFLINILVPQAYQINEQGYLLNGVDPEVLALAQKYTIKLMPLITNTGFNTKTVHIFLSNLDAQEATITAILIACKLHHFYGVQFDFEMVAAADKAALTHFYQLAAKRLHQAGFKISFAVAPVVTDFPTAIFQQRIYNHWEATYDLKALGECGDFVSIMAYNQHASITTPGATASFSWVNQIIKHALNFIPPEKISLGIATYSTHWYTYFDKQQDQFKAQADALSYEQTNQLLQKNHAHLIWDADSKSDYSLYEHDWLNEYIFAEDFNSFAAKLYLVNKYKLRGISIFCIGSEDFKIWNII